LHGQPHAGSAGTAAKKKSTHAAEQDRADVAAAREVWFEKFSDVRVNQLVFLDEFGATTNMQRTHGRAPPGQRVVAKVPHGHWKVISTIAAMSVKGIIASASFDGATDTELFVAFIGEGLAPALKARQVVVIRFMVDSRAPGKGRRKRFESSPA
jgi:DDE superfamily endonuclease